MTQKCARNLSELSRLARLLVVAVASVAFFLFTAPSSSDYFEDESPYASSAAWVNVHADLAGNRRAPLPKKLIRRKTPQHQHYAFDQNATQSVALSEIVIPPQYYISTDKIRDPPQTVQI